MIKSVFFLILLLSIVGCAKESDDNDSSSGGATTIIPDVTFSCSNSTNCADDSANAKVTYVVFYKVACSSIGSPNSTNAYALGAGSTSCSGGTCTGTVSTFTDFESNSVSTVDADVSTMTVYAYIDINDNSSPDSGEPYYCADNVDFTTAISMTGGTWTNQP
jgi:hypothetical protein